ncbi:hypothetical protein G9A89_008203 [Geosiphon pyriformis]|nr:hypothetical protein G9A89_008203 [Geosiphon pyriformis]
MHLKSTLSVFASASAMVPAPQMTATSFVTHPQDPNKQLIDKLTANLAQLLKPLAQAVRDNQQPQRLRFEPCFNQPQQLPYKRQQNRGPPVCYCCGLTEHFSRDSINTFKSTRKKIKAKVNFVLDSKKASTSTVDNNELLKTKVFKNPPKLELPEIVQKSGHYSVVKNLMETPVHITFGQLMIHLQLRKNLYKLLISIKKTPKTNKHLHQAGLADNNNITSLICKAQVAGYFIDLILDSRSSISVIAKHFLEAIGRKIDELFIQPMTNVHGNKKKALNIAKAIPVCINDISIKTDMEVSKAKEYIIIVDNKWLKKAKALLDYELCELIIRCGKKPIVIKCQHWTTFPVLKQNQEEEQSDESNDNKSDNEDQEEQEETAKLLLNNIKADKKRIIVNGKLICWPYYDIFRRIFDRKPSKKPNTIIGGMVLVHNAGVINLCIYQVINANPA